jgi:hypothetical protein
MLCPKCGKELPDLVSACIFCGHNFSAVTTSTPFNPGKAPTNTSGSGDTTIIPEEIKGWSWVSSLWCLAPLPWIWGWTYLFHLEISLSLSISVFCLIVSFVFGNKGKEWAWRHKHWKNLNQFKLTRILWIILWLFFMSVSTATIVYAIYRSASTRNQEEMATDAAANNMSSELVISINSYFLIRDQFPWIDGTPIPDYFTTNVGKEVWLATLVAENQLLPSSISKINHGTNLILFNDNDLIRICYIPIAKANKEIAKNQCLQNMLPKFDAIPLCNQGSEYICLPETIAKNN